ncbi:MAG: class I SAM-dependent methyltransferase, partial [Caldilineae bacterium]
MQPAEYANLAAHEESHWWFAGKREAVLWCLARFGPPQPAMWRVLDVGCGPGATLTALREHFPFVVGVDYAPEALHYAARRHQRRLCRGNALALPFAGNTFHAVTALDVLYQRWVTDDRAALGEMHRVLKPGGLLVATVPAFD